MVPLKKEGQGLVLQAILFFAKAISAPDALIHDASRSQKSHEVRKYCNDIGTALRVLEENTPWTNKVELHMNYKKSCPQGHERSQLSIVILGLLYGEMSSHT